MPHCSSLCLRVDSLQVFSKLEWPEKLGRVPVLLESRSEAFFWTPSGSSPPFSKFQGPVLAPSVSLAGHTLSAAGSSWDWPYRLFPARCPP